MHAEPARLRHRIDQARKRRTSAERKIAAARQERRRNVFAGETDQRLRQRHGAETCGIDEDWRGEPKSVARRRVAALQRHAARRVDFAMRDRRTEGDGAAAILEIALHGEHVAVAVDDAGGGRMECRRAGDVRLHGHGLLRREMLKIVDAVRVGACENRRELVLLIVVGRDDQFAAAPMFYAALSAELVQRLLARNAQLRLGAARRIIDARMDDLGIARTGARADHRTRLRRQRLRDPIAPARAPPPGRQRRRLPRSHRRVRSCRSFVFANHRQALAHRRCARGPRLHQA